jgi:hypothetical protein
MIGIELLVIGVSIVLLCWFIPFRSDKKDNDLTEINRDIRDKMHRIKRP